MRLYFINKNKQKEEEQDKYPLMPGKKIITQEVIENSAEVQGDLELEGIHDPYEESYRKVSKLRKFLCKLGIHKWSQKRYVSNWDTGKRYSKRYCKICGKKQFK